MAFSCVVHQWYSDVAPCPACVTTVSASSDLYGPGHNSPPLSNGNAITAIHPIDEAKEVINKLLSVIPIGKPFNVYLPGFDEAVKAAKDFLNK